MRIVDAPNTYNPALIAIKSMGYALGIEPSEEADQLGFWTAEKEGVRAQAGDPLALLGLVALVEARGINWRRAEDEDLYDKVISQVYGD